MLLLMSSKRFTNWPSYLPADDGPTLFSNAVCTKASKMVLARLFDLYKKQVGRAPNSELDVVRSLSVKFIENVILCHSSVTKDANMLKHLLSTRVCFQWDRTRFL